MTDTPVVSLRRAEGIAIITIDNPPVNALGLAVRQPLGDMLKSLRDDTSVEGIILACAGRTFIAGAEISEIGTERGRSGPLITDIVATMETIRVPLVAAIHGTALGGGIEIALGCSHRIMHAEAKAGLPEVKLGFLPGAGGTVRLPRLVGPLKALDMIVGGAPIGAAEALEAGLADRVTETNPTDEALALVKELNRTGNYQTRPVRDRDEKLAETRRDASAFEARVKQLLARSGGLRAPAACAEAVRNAVFLPFEEAAAKERELFLELSAGLESQALRHLFFATRAAAKIADIGPDAKPRTVANVGIIGAGTMGAGIATAFADGGYAVTVLETSQEGLDRGLAMIERNYSGSVSRGSLTEEQKSERLRRLTPTLDFSALADCDLVIEAVFENMAVKKDVFRRLGAIAKSGAVLATNTSYLDVNEIAQASGRPADVVGLHFFSPAHVMKLLEIVRARQTAPDVILTALSVASRIGKVPVVVGVCHGFVGNRIYSTYRRHAEYLMEDGASPYEIDAALTSFGFAMGPFAVSDLSGLDISHAMRRSLDATRDPDERYVAIADRLFEAGRLGRKSGAGYYSYQSGKAEPDPAVEAIVAAERAAKGIVPRAFLAEEIERRLLAVMVNEGAAILEEGIAQRASDIDLVLVNGYGFPRGKGGPMFYADRIGLRTVVDEVRAAEAANPGSIRLMPLLEKLAAEKRSLTSWPG
jgi:3-hydroxyacyl-CoA dehydrogenase